MKEQIILFGDGGHCRSCIDVIEKENHYKIKGLIGSQKIDKDILGYSIIDVYSNLEKIVNKYSNFFISIGFIKSYKRRKELFEKIKLLGGNFPSIISPLSYVSKYTKIGEGTIIMHKAIINASAAIGKNCIINTKALIEHDAIISDNTHISTGAIVNGGCSIGENCFIGSGTIINEGININSNSIIGSFSLVNKDITEQGTYFGNPLRKIK